VADAFYLPTDDPDVFTATERTVGPWEPGVQHAGPPSALITRAIEALPSTIAGDNQLARLTMEILSPIPTGDVTVTAQVVRRGRSVELIEAELTAAGRAAMRSRAWRIRSTPLALPEGVIGQPATPPPIPPAETGFRDTPWPGGYLGSVGFHFVEGHFEDPGPAAVWTRLKVALVAGEQPSPTQRLMAIADSGNGLSSLLDPSCWLFINTELTVHLHRIPAGEWIYIVAKSTLDTHGVGLAESELFDATGRVGRGAQALMVGHRQVS
jgi:hypothetical protein